VSKQLDQLQAEKSKLHKEKVDLENQLEAEQVHVVGVCACVFGCGGLVV
jgi:hypothetical protein